MTEYLETGTFSVDAEACTVRGLLMPWNESSNVAHANLPIAFVPGSIPVPTDVSIVTANIAHDSFTPVGRATAIEDTERGLVATFSIARTEDGDRFLEEHKAGRLTKLSAEIRGIVRDAKDRSKGVAAVLTGAAFCSQGAFASAALFSLDVPNEDDVEPTEHERLLERIAALEARVPETPEATEAEEETPNPTDEPDAPATEEETIVAEAQVPNTAATPEVAKEETSATGVFELITQARKPMSGAETETMLAALADIKTSGTGALPANGVLQPAWLGEIWADRGYERRYFPLVKNGSITNVDEKGYVLDSAELMQPWSGNKTELPTGTGSTSLISSTFQRFGFAVDIAREFFDIPGNNDVIEAFIRRIATSYSRVSDKYALGLIHTAGAANRVDASTYPTDYPEALGKLIQAVDHIDDTDATPSFVIVAPDVYTELRFTPKDKLPEFVTFGAGRQEGSADGVTVLRDKFGVLAAGEVLAGSREAAHLNELPGASPLQLDALDIARGGVDKAAVAYVQSMVEYPEGFVIVGDKA